MHKRHIWILALCPGGLSACDSSNKIDPKLDAGSGLDASDQAAQVLCAAAASWTQNAGLKAEFKAAVCRATSFFAAAASGASSPETLKASCGKAHDDCVANKDVETPFDGSACVLPEVCDISPLELQACVSDWVETMKTTFLAFPSCEALVPTDLEAQALEQRSQLYRRPKSCEVVESKCPTLLL